MLLNTHQQVRWSGIRCSGWRDVAEMCWWNVAEYTLASALVRHSVFRLVECC